MLRPSMRANLHISEAFGSCYDRFKGSVFGTTDYLEVEFSPIDIRRVIVTNHHAMYDVTTVTRPYRLPACIVTAATFNDPGMS